MLVEERLGDAQKGWHILRSNETHTTCLLEGGPEIRQGFGKSRTANLGQDHAGPQLRHRLRRLAQCRSFQTAPVRRREGHPCSPHRKRRFPWTAPRDFLVPRRWAGLKEAVDSSDRVESLHHRARNVPTFGRTKNNAGPLAATSPPRLGPANTTIAKSCISHAAQAWSRAGCTSLQARELSRASQECRSEAASGRRKRRDQRRPFSVGRERRFFACPE